jgi:hypothetical protein
VIFISFHNTTNYQANETNLPLNSLLSRIAYAIAEPSSTKGLNLHNDEGKLQFLTSESEILAWLGKNPCILCIDELNKLIHKDNQVNMDTVNMDTVNMDTVAFFLQTNFLSSPQRYFIFTSRFNSITYELIISMNSDRLVHRVGLPVFTTADEVNTVLQKKTDIHPMYYGNSPGLSYTCLKISSYPEERVGKFLTSKIKNTQISGSSIIRNIFSGDHNCIELQEFDTITRISSNNTNDETTRIWIPAFLKHLFSVAQFTDLSKEHSDRASDLLASLGKEKLYSGQAWEKAVLCGLFFRILGQFHVTQQYAGSYPSSAFIPIFPILPPPGTFEITVEYPHEELNNVVNALLVPRSKPSVILSYPHQSAFPLYDIFIYLLQFIMGAKLKYGLPM